MILDRPELIRTYSEQGWWGDERLIDLFLANVQRTPDHIALVDPPNRPDLVGGEPLRLTYRELQAKVDRLASALLAEGVAKDDVVMVQLPNIAELVIAYLAIARIGAVISPVAIQYRSHELSYIAPLVEPKVYITIAHFEQTNFVDLVQSLPIPSLQTIVAVGEDLPDGVLSLHSILETPHDSFAIDQYIAHAEWSANDIYTVCWTSGTEAEPKGVPRSHNHWISIAYFSVDGCQIGEGDALLNPFPMVNMSSIGGMLVPWLLTGGKLVMHHPLNLPVFLQQIQNEQINYTVAPPVLLNLLLLKPALMQGIDLSSIKNIGSGSAPLSPWMVSQWDERFNINVLNMFGSNEGTALVSGPQDIPSPAERATYFPRFGVEGFSWSVRMAPAMQTKLVDPLTKAVITERDQTGELAIKGPTIFPGYYQRPDLTETAFDEDGYFYTGDLFAIDGVEADNRYRFVGRLKDIVIRGGMKISPEEIELLLTEHPSVAEVAVIGCPDQRLGGDEQVIAVVVLRPDTSLDKLEVAEFLKSKDVAHYKLPKRLEFVSALPRNPLGKVLKRTLRQQICASENN